MSSYVPLAESYVVLKDHKPGSKLPNLLEVILAKPWQDLGTITVINKISAYAHLQALSNPATSLKTVTSLQQTPPSAERSGPRHHHPLARAQSRNLGFGIFLLRDPSQRCRHMAKLKGSMRRPVSVQPVLPNRDNKALHYCGKRRRLLVPSAAELYLRRRQWIGTLAQDRSAAWSSHSGKR